MKTSIRLLTPLARAFAGAAALLLLAGCGEENAPIDALPKAERPSTFIQGTVEIAPELAGKVERGDSLYVVLRQPASSDGKSGQLVAAVKAQSVGFPYRFVVTKESARSATLFQGPLELSALLSKRGAATPAKGDLVGAFAGNPVEPGRRDLVVTIDEIVEKDAAPTTPAAGAAPSGELVETGRDTVEGTVAISPELAELADPHAPLFIFLRSPTMPGPPLAMLKIDHPTYPVSFSLSKENVIFDNMEFKPPMTLHARLSKSGSPVGQPGDLEGTFAGAEVAPGMSGYQVVLDAVVQDKRASSMDNRPKESLE